VASVTLSRDQLHSIIHWSILSTLIYETESPESVLDFEIKSRYIGEQDEFVYFMDSHFHLDMLSRKAGYSDLPIGDLDEAGELLDIAIANYCFSRNWPSYSERIKIKKDTRVRLTFGIHPRMAVMGTRASLQSLCKQLEELKHNEPDIVSVGECACADLTHPAKFLYNR